MRYIECVAMEIVMTNLRRGPMTNLRYRLVDLARRAMLDFRGDRDDRDAVVRFLVPPRIPRFSLAPDPSVDSGIPPVGEVRRALLGFGRDRIPAWKVSFGDDVFFYTADHQVWEPDHLSGDAP
jgi:hypothetical protein